MRTALLCVGLRFASEINRPKVNGEGTFQACTICVRVIIMRTATPRPEEDWFVGGGGSCPHPHLLVRKDLIYAGWLVFQYS